MEDETPEPDVCPHCLLVDKLADEVATYLNQRLTVVMPPETEFLERVDYFRSIVLALGSRLVIQGALVPASNN